jgi:hypothetical protein
MRQYTAPSQAVSFSGSDVLPRFGEAMGAKRRVKALARRSDEREATASRPWLAEAMGAKRQRQGLGSPKR